MSSFSESISPTFSNPPVIETALAIQSNDLKTLLSRHFVEFWQQYIRGQFECEVIADAPRLDRIIEPHRLTRSISSFHFGTAPTVARFVITGASTPQEMFQMQADRIAVNWLRVEDVEYSRFRTVAPKLNKIYEDFRSFCREYDLGIWTPDLYEVTYVNKVSGLKGESVADIATRYLRGLDGHFSNSFLPIESLSFSRTYSLPENSGRVHVSIGQELNAEVSSLLVNIVSRIHAKSESLMSIENGLTVAHDWAVKTFLEISNDESQRIWGISNALPIQ